jgi:hypothetical protein
MTHILFLFDDPRPVLLCGARVRILADASLRPADADFVGDAGLVTAAQGTLVDCPVCRERAEVAPLEVPADAARSWREAVRRLRGQPS